MMETLGSAQIFAVMAVLHPLAALLLWTMVRPEEPTTQMRSSENQSRA
jgi:ACS family hexuronate transporter-like MFS transporter